MGMVVVLMGVKVLGMAMLIFVVRMNVVGIIVCELIMANVAIILLIKQVLYVSFYGSGWG